MLLWIYLYQFFSRHPLTRHRIRVWIIRDLPTPPFWLAIAMVFIIFHSLFLKNKKTERNVLLSGTSNGNRTHDIQSESVSFCLPLLTLVYTQPDLLNSYVLPLNYTPMLRFLSRQIIKYWKEDSKNNRKRLFLRTAKLRNVVEGHDPSIICF